ncbi:hypothetical protein F5Y04DRAFT_292146 [Hypomontagnella monticulosa]|nr:hypothetical protein F5Y04DRAFT_292146 [Hypomontagnella monticulosa]
MKAASVLLSLAAAGLALAQSAPTPIPTILGIRGANSGGCFSATSMNLAFSANNLKLDFADMRASVTPTDSYDSEAAICVMTIELGAFPQGWRFGLSDVTYTGHAKLVGGARLHSFAVNAYFQWEHLKNNEPIDEPTVKNASGSYLMNIPEKIVDFGKTGIYDSDFKVNIPNGNIAWSPCFTGQEYSYDDKMQVQFQFQAYLTKEGFPKTGSGVFGRATGPALTADFKVVWEKCDSAQRNSWGQFRMGDYESCQRLDPSSGTDGQPTVRW